MGYHIRVKVCGITQAEDLQEAARMGVDAVGLNFHPPSPRSVTTEEGQELLRVLPPFVEAVGVFVKKTVAEVWNLVGQLGRIRTIQVHGGSPEIVDAFPYHYVPAFSIRAAADLTGIVRYLQTCQMVGRMPSAILVDGHAPGLHGGTGQTAPWDLLAGFDPGVPLILAGGLTPDNVAEAVRIVRPWGVDVASGVEARPGWKDFKQMRRFIEAAREAAWAL